MLYGITSREAASKKWVGREFEEVMEIDSETSEKQIINGVHNMMNAFNNTLRPYEVEREVVSIYTISEEDQPTHTDEFYNFRTMWECLNKVETIDKFKDIADSVLKQTLEAIQLGSSAHEKSAIKHKLAKITGVGYWTIKDMMDNFGETFEIDSEEFLDILTGDFTKDKPLSFWFFDLQEKWYKILGYAVNHEMSKTDFHFVELWHVDRDEAPALELEVIIPVKSELNLEVTTLPEDENDEFDEFKSLSELFD